MSSFSESPQSPAADDLRRRVLELENELLTLRSELEQQSWRMAQLVLENASLKTELANDPVAREAAREAARKANRNRAALVTHEEREYALTMGRGLSRPSPETLRRR